MQLLLVNYGMYKRGVGRTKLRMTLRSLQMGVPDLPHLAFIASPCQEEGRNWPYNWINMSGPQLGPSAWSLAKCQSLDIP